MKLYIQIYLVLLLSAFMASCRGQNKTNLIKDDISQAERILTDGISIPEDSNFTSSPYGPSRITRTIMQDNKGNTWLATYEGVIIYNSASGRFTNFTKNKGIDPCNAWAVLEDKNGKLWIATDGAGVYRYDPVSNGFTQFTTKDSLAHNRVLEIYEDSVGNIWFATMGGASCYNSTTGRFTNFTTKEGLPHDDVKVIIEDKTGKFWFGTRGNVCVYDGKTLAATQQGTSEGKAEFIELTNDDGVPFKNILSIIEDKRGNIWLGGPDGLWRYNRSADQEGGSSFTNFTMDGVSCVYEDKKGNIWTATDAWTNKGQPNPHEWALSRYDMSAAQSSEKSLVNEKVTATQIGKEKGMFFEISEDKAGNIWVGTLKGVFRYDPSEERIGRKSQPAGEDRFYHFKDEGTKE